MSRKFGNLDLPFSFEPTSQAPLDSRLVVPKQSDLVAPETYVAKNYYKGMTVTVQEDGSIWTLMDPENITSLDSWVKQTSGAGASEIIVVDNLTTDNSSNALSARQGKVLGEKIQEILDSKGEANGIATLGPDGKVPSSQLPSYVDDVLEFDSKEDFPEEGESGKIYVDKATNTTWRWGGTEYANVGSSLALGETSETAWAGDKGKETQEKVETLEEKLKEIEETVIPGLESASEDKVSWSEGKKTIELPSDGSIKAVIPGQEEDTNPETTLLIGQRVETTNGESKTVTEVGSIENELTLNSKSGKVMVGTEEGQKTVAFEEDLKEAIDGALSWWEEQVVIKWDGISKTEPAYDETTQTFSIGEASELAWIDEHLENFDGKTVILTNDIDLDSKPWKAIGSEVGAMSGNPNAKYFKGTFDGKGYSIKNLSCEVSDEYAKAGLFAALQGTVKNLVIDGAELKTTHYAGAIAAYNRGTACIIENCEARNVNIIDSFTVDSEGNTDNGDKAGVIAGYICANGSKINGCKVLNSFVKAYRDLGGIVGYVGSNKITVELSGNTIKNVTLIQDLTNGYKDVSAVTGHVGTLYGWKDNNTIISENNTGEANIIVINPEQSPE